MHSCLKRFTFVFLFAGMAWTFQVSAVSAFDDRLELVRTAWETRKKAAESLHLKLSSVRIAPPPSREITDEDRKAGNTGPRAHRLTSELWYSGDKLAIETRLRDPLDVPWFPPRSRYVHNEFGSQRIHANKKSVEFDRGAHGAVTHDRQDPRYGLFDEFRLVAVAYRFTENGPFAFPLSTCEVLPASRKTGDTDCLVLLSTGGGTVHVATEVWVDPERDYVPLRILQRIGEVPYHQSDAEYRPHPTVGYAVTSWKLTLVESTGELVGSEDVVVDEFDATTVIPDSTFQIDFPAGSTVLLGETNKRVVVGENGTVPGFSKQELKTTNWKWVLVVSVVIIAGCIILFRVRKKVN